MQCFVERMRGVVNTDDCADETKKYDCAIEELHVPGEGVTFQLEMEVAGPDEREHVSGEVADEAHEEVEVWHEDGHDEDERNEKQTKCD